MNTPVSPQRRERTLAFQALFMLDVGQVDEQTAASYVAEQGLEEAERLWTQKRVHGAWSQRQDIDQLLQGHLNNWKWDRIGRVERSLLRLATYEMLHCQDELTFTAAISEALELAKEYADEKSVPFLNGVLDAVWKSRSSQEPGEAS